MSPSRRFLRAPSLRAAGAAALAMCLGAGLGACRSTPRVTRTAAPPPTTQAWPAPGSAAAPLQRDLDDAKSLAYSASQTAAEARQQAEAARLEADRLAQQLDAERNRNAELGDELSDLRGRVEDLTRQAPPAGEPASARAAGDPLAELMAELEARSQAEVLREGNLVVVRVTDAFKPGSDSLKNDVQLITALNAAASALVRFPAASVSVVGHSDGDPIKKTANKWEDNQHLSQARAQRVAQVLAHNGVQESRITVEGRGFSDPLVSPESTRADKARNRRVEILIRM